MPVKCLLQGFSFSFTGQVKMLFHENTPRFLPFFLSLSNGDIKNEADLCFVLFVKEMLLNLFLGMFELNSLSLRIFLSYMIVLGTSS